MTDVERIYREVERLYDGEAPKHDQQCDFNDGYYMALAKVENFIEGLDGGMPDKDVEGEIERYFNGWEDGDEYGQALNGEGECVSVEEVKDIARRFCEMGVEWAFGQGITSEHTVGRTPLNGPNGIVVHLNDFDGFRNGDRVIVQVRKK